MSKPTYGKALNLVLAPLGFVRKGNDFVRIRGDLWECVNLQFSFVAGTTANLEKKDLETQKLLKEALATDWEDCLSPISIRIGHLIDGYDRWWLRDPDGSAKLAEAVKTHAPAYFERVNSLEEQAANWYGRFGGRGRHLPSQIRLAITLYRMGELDEARSVIMEPLAKRAPASGVEEVMRVRRWLGCASSEEEEALPPAPPCP